MSDHQFSASRDVEMSPALPEPTASSSTSDPASSLRAAALLTLKSKRRKAQPSLTPALPSRPPTDNAFHLDYGQEESPSVSRDISHTLIVDPPKPTATPEIQTREEGEISDEENPEPTLARPKPRSPASLPPPPDINFGNARHPTPSTSALSQQYSLHTKPTLSERISDVPNMSNSVSLTQGDISDHVQNDLAPAFQDPGGLIDVDHVRPGVALNKVQYDRAKDNVLDLLGWGVAPEYLVDCGLTREIVYYVFSELNLRLPQNLDTTGLIPYRSDTSLLAERQKSALMPPPPPPQARRYSIGHLNPSSQAPTQKATHSPSRSTSPPPLPGISSVQGILSTPASPQPAPTSTLHDMEQQRRQELLARKAVIASRKSKQGSAPAASSPFPGMPIPSSNRQDVEMSVPTETVDDFLKTIGPSSNVGDVSTASSSLHQQPETDMDVDEIPGLGGAKQFTTTPSIPSRGSSRPPPPADTPISPTQSAHTPMSPNMCPPSSTESTSTTFTDKSGSHTPSDTPTLQEGPALQRRGAKRPVAADFVDLDGGNRLSSNGNGGYATGMHSGSRRRTGAGFANIANARRFIIDLSDSEGEGDGDVVMRDMGHSESAGRRSLYGSPAPTRPTVPSLNTSNGWATPPITTATPILSGTSLVQNGIMSPAALMEKEIEIQKMRELIAQREQRRLTKMAAAKAIAETCASTESSSVTVKREEMAISISTDNGSNFQNRLGGPSESLPLNHWHIDSATGSASISGSPSSSAPASATPPIDIVTGNSTCHTSNTTPEAETGYQVLNQETRQKHAVTSDDQAARTTVDVDPSTSTQIPAVMPALPKAVANQAPLEDLIAAQERHDQDYSTYDSPFKWYPLLASRARPLYTNSVIDPSSFLSSSSSASTSNSSSLASSSNLSFFTTPSSSSSASSLSFSPSTASVYPFHTDTAAFMLPDLRQLKLATTSKLLDPSKRICQYEVPGGGVCRDEGCEDVHLSRIAGHGRGGGAEPSDQDTVEYLLNTLPSGWLADNGVSHSKMSSAFQQVRLKNSQMGFEERVANILAALGPPLPP